MPKRVLTLDVLLSKEIENMITEERYKEKQRLPSERELASRFNVQRLTIRAALNILKERGLVYVKEKSGYYVSPKRIVIDLNDLKSTGSVIAQMGKESSTKLLEFEIIRVNETLAKSAMLAEDTEVFRLMRLRYENRNPLALERSYIVYEYAQDLKAKDIDHGSLYRVLKNKFNISFTYSNQKVSIVNANSLESELLHVDQLTPLMRFEGLVYDRKGRMVEFFDHIMLIDRIEFVTDRF